MCVCVLREGDMVVTHSNLLLWGTCETWASGWVLPLPTNRSPVQTEVREPVLDDDHHVADGEEEGGNLK